MTKRDEQILRTAKEITVKFIETGRISPTGFPDLFKTVYQTVNGTVKQENAQDKEAAKDSDQK